MRNQHDCQAQNNYAWLVTIDCIFIETNLNEIPLLSTQPAQKPKQHASLVFVVSKSEG